MRLLLCSKSVIIRQNSKYEEFYSYLLKNSLDYIQYNNVEDLRKIFNFLENRPDVYNAIVNKNLYFVQNILNYENILHYCKVLINALTA